MYVYVCVYIYLQHGFHTLLILAFARIFFFITNLPFLLYID